MGLLKENRNSADKAAAKVMRITFILFILVLVLDIVGIFVVELSYMITAFIIGSVALLLPSLVVNVMKKSGEWVKFFIVGCAVIFTVDLTIVLSYHAVLLYVYPIAIASLYFSGVLNIAAAILSVIGVTVGQILSFNFQFVSDHNVDDMNDVIIFGVVPRAIILIAISAIFTMLSKRTAAMLGSLMGAEQQQIIREKSMEISDKLLNTVNELDKISSAANESNKSISDESEKVLNDSEENSIHIKAVEENMNSISDNLRSLAEMSSRIGILTKQADEITADNNKKMELAASSMEEICRETDESMEIISRLSEQSKRIVQIANVITEISSQTNILALNASVEAAHAGAHGKGFAVVASEIKKLSEETKSAAADIGEIISSVTQDISGTVAAMEKNARLTREGMTHMEHVKESTMELTRSNTEISGNIGSMNNVIVQLSDNGRNVSEKLMSVSENITGNCGAVEHMAAAIQENNAGTANLTNMVKNIKNMSEELSSLVQ